MDNPLNVTSPTTAEQLAYEALITSLSTAERLAFEFLTETDNREEALRDLPQEYGYGGEFGWWLRVRLGLNNLMHHPWGEYLMEGLMETEGLGTEALYNLLRQERDR